MTPVRRLLLAAFFGLTALVPAMAETLEPIVLPPIQHTDAMLTVTGPSGQFRFSPAELEALGSFRLVTTTPWRPEAATFDGVLLRDVLALAGLEEAESLVVTAENDFAITMPRNVWQSVPILLATRVNGEAHTRRERGPIQFVMPMDLYQSTQGMKEGYWIWMAAKIDAGL